MYLLFIDYLNPEINVKYFLDTILADLFANNFDSIGDENLK